ncbi:MAG: DUF1638 domain-containing protein [Deltaproteobacteria bacterium]|nr:DUF1638 domain-containing protein [Deltaproteobacteria bacterium]
MPPCLIACEIFRSALIVLKIQKRYPELKIHFLPGHLHLQPQELKKRILAEIKKLRGKGYQVGCLYGHCFEDIDEVLEEAAVPRIRMHHCFEILVGSERFQQMIQDQAGTFFMEKELVENFDAYCWKPLELYDPQMRRWYFEHYRQVAYIRQPLDPDLSAQVRRIAEALELRLQVVKADYQELDSALTRLIDTLYAA